LTQLLARLEVRYVLLRYQHLLARLRIASDAGWTAVQAEAAEAANFNAMTFGKRLRHRIEHRLHREIRIFENKLRKSRSQLGDQFRFGHTAADLSGLLVLAVELGLQQRAEVRRAGSSSARIRSSETTDGFLLLSRILRLDRQVDAARLAIDVDDHRVDLVAFLQHVASVFHAVLSDFRSAQIAFDFTRQLDHSTLRVDRLDGTVDDRTLIVHCN